MPGIAPAIVAAIIGAGSTAISTGIGLATRPSGNVTPPPAVPDPTQTALQKAQTAGIARSTTANAQSQLGGAAPDYIQNLVQLAMSQNGLPSTLTPNIGGGGMNGGLG